MNRHDIMVIGGGPAGITLAKMLGKMDIAIIRPEKASMIYCAMPYVIEGLITHEDTLKSDGLVTDNGAVLIRDAVEHIDFDEKILRMTSGDAYEYGKLVIASGAVPFTPPVPGHELIGVMGFKTENDMNAIIRMVDDGLTRAVIVGAGAIGIELAQALKDRDVDVHLVDMANSILPNLIDENMSEQAYRELEESGMNIHLKVKVTEIRGDREAEGVILDTGEVIDLTGPEGKSGLVVFAAGTRPEISLVENSPVQVGRDGIIVNDRMETNLPDVYAVGDCVQFHSGITGETTSGKLATNAVPMAKILGFIFLGQDRHYPGFYNGAATKVGHLFIGGTGLTESAAVKAGYEVFTGYSAVTTKFPIIPGAKKKQMKLVVDRATHRVLGAQIVSEEPVIGCIDLITFAIQNESTVEDLSGLSYASQPHQSFYPAANLIVLAAEDIRKKISVPQPVA